ncbi:MAG: multiubiquitin domain-containing protein [Patescibacteria group bacterium]|nr:multiubiquitin domain-containing protein [Patescibacteria group bacterium]
MTPEDTSEVEELEIEEFAKKGGTEPAPKAKRYIIRIDKTKFTVTTPTMTGKAILELAGKVPPSAYKLTLKRHGGAAESIDLEQVVDFRAPGVERFMTMKRDQTEG